MSSRQKCRLVARGENFQIRMEQSYGGLCVNIWKCYLSNLSIYQSLYICIYTIYVYNKMDMTSLSIASKCLMNEFNFVFETHCTYKHTYNTKLRMQTKYIKLP